MLYTILLVVQVVIAIVLVGLILVQHGQGADAGAAFGSGASGTVFGAQGSANFLSRATAGLALAFFVIALVLTYLITSHQVGNQTSSNSVVDQMQKPGAQLLQQDDTAATAETAEPATTPEKQKTQQKQQQKPALKIPE